MKAIFISMDQAHYDDVLEVLRKNNQKGYTSWDEVTGKGSANGLPHLGSHAYPSLNSALFVITEDHHLEPLLAALKQLDEQSQNLGLRAFYWSIEGMI